MFGRPIRLKTTPTRIGSRDFIRDSAPVESARRRDDLYFAQSRRSFCDGGSRHGFARRANGRHGKRRKFDQRKSDRTDGRARGRRHFPKTAHEFGETALEVKNLTVYDLDVPNKKLVADVSFAVRKGEGLGISGLMGAGRSEPLTAIFGARFGKTSGEVFVENR